MRESPPEIGNIQFRALKRLLVSGHFLVNNHGNLQTVAWMALMKSMTIAVACLLVFALCSGCEKKSSGGEATPAGTSSLLYGSHFEGPQNSDRVIIFVHGIFGKPDDTWRANGDSYWPGMLSKDPEFPKADVFVASYPSPYFGNRMNVSEMASLLEAELEAAHIDKKYKEILFVCHSLGGIVVQQMLLDYRDVYAPKTKLIYFYATPMYGAFVANFGHVWSDDPLLRDLFKGDGSQFTATLAQSWRAGKFDSIHRYCAYEKQPTPDKAGIIVVPQESATYLCDSGIPTHAVPDANHISIVKPLSISSYPHVLLREAALSIWSSGVVARSEEQHAATPSVTAETKVVKSICDLYGEAPSGAPAWNKFETCVIPDVVHLDRDYRQVDFNCCGGGATSTVTAKDVPPGLEIRTDGGYYWAIPEIRLSNDQMTIKTYCGPGAAGQPGCNVKVKLLGHYKF
jgi:pimeloyl-ACP methyl ester carboxylesterase